jgi:hypothetical protein
MAHLRSAVTRWRPLVAAALLLPALLVPALPLLFGGLSHPAGAATAGPVNSVFAYGSASTAVPNQSGFEGPVSAIASTPSGNGYWVTDSAGQVSTEGDAQNFGSITGALNAPIIGMAATPSGNGYWLVGGDGGIFTFGGAQFFGSTGGMVLNKPIVGMAPTPSGNGYWLVASDGGVFSFGDAAFWGSTGNIHLNQPVDGMAATPSGDGYWLVASDGGVFSFGDATFYGSMGATRLVAPVVGMTAMPDGGGYRMVAADGGIFDFGDAGFYGSGTGEPLTAPVVGMAARPGGYWIAYGATAPLSTILGQEEVLDGLGYGPLSWSPLGFEWRWAPQPTLATLWSPGQDGAIASGEIMAFEAEDGLPIDGVISSNEINALQAAADDPTGPLSNANGFTYALATEDSPETLTVWQNGVEVAETLSNTGGPGTPTALGSFPVYQRYLNQIMRGTDPDGATYADPVKYVSYFNGSDALHYFPRASYGFPQSLGCVELPLQAASIVWQYTTIGSIVTVT